MTHQKKKLKHLILTSLVFLIFQISNAQTNYTISGYIKDSLTTENLVGATFYIEELQTGTATNSYGYYSLTIPAGSYTFRIQQLGYQDHVVNLSLDNSFVKDFELTQKTLQLSVVEVKAENDNKRVQDIDMSKDRLDLEKIRSLPTFLGEVDILKNIQLLPGIQTAEEGTSGLFVRGSAADQTLILLDEATVYNPSHLLGFVSVFNVDALKDVTVYKGGIPARFGGRLASVVDISMKEGNMKKYQFSGGFGNLSGRLTVEGPIVKDKASFIISGRRTFLDLFLLFLPEDDPGRDSKIVFYDLNAKVNVKLSPKDRLYFSSYFGKDILNFDQDFGLDWGNRTVSFRWNHLFGQKIFSNTTFLYSNYDYGFFSGQEGNEQFDWVSNLEQLTAKIAFSYFPNPNHHVEFGFQGIGYKFAPAEITPRGENSIFRGLSLQNRYALEGAFFLSNEQSIGDRFGIDYGLRFSLFSQVGPGKIILYEDPEAPSDENIIDSLSFGNWENIQRYSGLEPRLGLRYLINDEQSIKAFYNRTFQYIQVVSNSTAGTPFDRWVPSDTYIQPQRSDQVAVGYFRNFANNRFETSVEMFYKWMNNQVDVRDGADVLLNDNLERELLTGTAEAYGLEFLIKKNTGKLTGMISYTFSRVQRTIEGINQGEPYSPRYDKPHNLAVVSTYNFSKKMRLSGNFIFTSGSAVTYPVGAYQIEGIRTPLYNNSRNEQRFPAYHRLDLSFTIDGKLKRWIKKKRKKTVDESAPKKKKRKIKVSRTFTLYNIYNRRNAFNIQFRDVINGDPSIPSDTTNGVDTREPEAVRLSLFGIFPMVTYNFKF